MLVFSVGVARLLFESGDYFVQHFRRCGDYSRAATNRERRLIERIRYVCMYVCMYVCVYVYVCMYVCILYVCVCVCMYVCVCVCMYVCMYV